MSLTRKIPMLEAFRQRWHAFRRLTPGKRFQTLFDRRRVRRGGFSIRILTMLLGGVLVFVGLVLMLIPGPGIPIAAVGAVLLARESRCAARFLDRLEGHGRRLTRATIDWWRNASPAIQAILVLSAMAAIAIAVQVIWG